MSKRIITYTPNSEIIEEEKKGTFYHYTSIDALINIIQREHLVMRGTNYLYLNDGVEIKFGIDQMKQHFIIDEDEYKHLFIISFSSSADNLAMWQTYSDNYTGCIIGIKGDMIENPRCNYARCSYNIEDAIFHYNDIANGVNPTEIFKLYADASITLDPQLKLMIENAKPTMRYNIIVAIKHPSFHYENEMRIYTTLSDAEEYIKYRSRNGLIIPYVEFEIRKEALSEIWLPNDNKTDLNKKALEKMLQDYGYQNVEIKVSQTSFRRI